MVSFTTTRIEFVRWSRSTSSLRVVLNEKRLNKVVEEERAALEREPGLRQEALEDAWKEILRAQRSALNRMFQEKAISGEVYEALAEEVDQALVAPHSGLSCRRDRSFQR
jgi:hypothetical protein